MCIYVRNIIITVNDKKLKRDMISLSVKKPARQLFFIAGWKIDFENHQQKRKEQRHTYALIFTHPLSFL